MSAAKVLKSRLIPSSGLTGCQIAGLAGKIREKTVPWLALLATSNEPWFNCVNSWQSFSPRPDPCSPAVPLAL